MWGAESISDSSLKSQSPRSPSLRPSRRPPQNLRHPLPDVSSPSVSPSCKPWLSPPDKYSIIVTSVIGIYNSHPTLLLRHHFFFTSSRSSFIRSSKSYSFCFSSNFFLLTSKRFFTWSREERSTRIDMPKFLWSAHAQNTQLTQFIITPSLMWLKLTLLSIDVVQEVNGVFYYTVTDITVITER